MGDGVETPMAIMTTTAPLSGANKNNSVVFATFNRILMLNICE